jgi:hypothetical protein
MLAAVRGLLDDRELLWRLGGRHLLHRWLLRSGHDPVARTKKSYMARAMPI